MWILVGAWSLPLWTIWVCQSGWWHSRSIWRKYNSCSRPPTSSDLLHLLLSILMCSSQVLRIICLIRNWNQRLDHWIQFPWKRWGMKAGLQHPELLEITAIPELGTIVTSDQSVFAILSRKANFPTEKMFQSPSTIIPLWNPIVDGETALFHHVSSLNPISSPLLLAFHHHFLPYPLVNQHSCGKSPSLWVNQLFQWPCSLCAM